MKDLSGSFLVGWGLRPSRRLASSDVSVSSAVGPMKSCSALVGVDRPLASNFSFPRAFRGASSPDASASKWHRLWSLPSGHLAVGGAALAALRSSREGQAPTGREGTLATRSSSWIVASQIRAECLLCLPVPCRSRRGDGHSVLVCEGPVRPGAGLILGLCSRS